MNKKQTNPQKLKVLDDFNYGMALYDTLGDRFESWAKILCIDSASYESLVLSTNLTSSHPVAIMIICNLKDIKLSSTMLRTGFQRCCEDNDQMSTRGLHKTVPENWQIRTTQNSALQCSYERSGIGWRRSGICGCLRRSDTIVSVGRALGGGATVAGPAFRLLGFEHHRNN